MSLMQFYLHLKLTLQWLDWEFGLADASYYIYVIQTTRSYCIAHGLLSISVIKSRDITLPTKVNLVKAMVFPVVMYGCESWTIKKTEH